MTVRFTVWKAPFCYAASLALAAATLCIVGVANAKAPPDALDRVENFNDPQVRVCPDGKYESGCSREDISNAVNVDEEFSGNLAEICLFQTKASCFPSAYGIIPPTKQSHSITWQNMTIQPEDGPRIEMLVMIETESEFPPNVLVSRQTEGWYGAPQIVRASDDLLMIHAPGRSGGTGMGNVDVVLTKHPMGWTTFDVNVFLEAASHLLPKGFSLSSPANFDFREMFASVPVKREGDGGCCATGGVAYLDLGLPKPNWMQVDAITFEEMTPVKTHRIKATENLMEYGVETEVGKE